MLGILWCEATEVRQNYSHLPYTPKCVMFYSYTVKKLSLKSLYKSVHSLHCKKRLAVFPSPAGMSLTKLSLAGNNLIIPTQGEFGKWHPGWGRKTANIFYSVQTVFIVFLGLVFVIDMKYVKFHMHILQIRKVIFTLWSNIWSYKNKTSLQNV